MCFLLDDFDRGPNNTRRNLGSSTREDTTVGMIYRQKKPANQAVDKRQCDYRMIEDAVWPEELLGEEREHVYPAARSASLDGQPRREVDLRRQLPAKCIAESVLNNVAVDLHTQ